jgi:hypothetical protein
VSLGVEPTKGDIVSNHREQIVEAAKGKVAEPLLGATFAKPRGATTAGAAGGIGGLVGGQWAGKQRKGAAAAGIQLGSPGALAVTPTSLVTMEVGVSLGGQIKSVKEVLSVVPLADVDSVEVKRMGLAGVMEISVAGNTFKLEGKVADMREFAAAFHSAKASAS